MHYSRIKNTFIFYIWPKCAKQCMVVHFLNWVERSIGRALVSVLKERHSMQCHHKYVVLCDIVSEKKNLLCFKIVHNSKKIQTCIEYDL